MKLRRLQRYTSFVGGPSRYSVFETDPGPEKKEAGGGGGSGDGKAQEELFDVTVGDGKVVKMTKKEVVEHASKAAGADRKFQEAAELRKQYEGIDLTAAKKGLRALELAKKGNKMTQAEANEFFEVLGIDPDEDATPGDKKAKSQKPSPIAIEQLDPRLKDAIQYSEESRLEKLENEIRGKVKNAVDKDEYLSKLSKSMPKNSQGTFLASLYEMAIDDTLGRVYQGQKLDADMLGLVVARVRKRAESMGIPELLAAKPPTSQRGGRMDDLGQGIHAEEPIKREKMGSDDYGQNAAQRLGQKLLQFRRRG